jgi:hypothetical protein
MTKGLELVDDFSVTKKNIGGLFSAFLCTLSEKMQLR